MPVKVPGVLPWAGAPHRTPPISSAGRRAPRSFPRPHSVIRHNLAVAFAPRQGKGRESDVQRLLDDSAAEQVFSPAQWTNQRMSVQYIFQHLADLSDEVNRLVERQNQVTFRERDLVGQLRHRMTEAPCSGQAKEGRVVSIGNEETVLTFLVDDRPLDFLDPFASPCEFRRKDKSIGIA